MNTFRIQIASRIKYFLIYKNIKQIPTKNQWHYYSPYKLLRIGVGIAGLAMIMNEKNKTLNASLISPSTDNLKTRSVPSVTDILTESPTPYILNYQGPNCEIVDKNANLLNYPPIKKYVTNHNFQITIGDLHANALKALYFLIAEDVLVLSEKDYYEMRTICNKTVDDLVQNDLERFKELLNKAKCKPSKLIRFLGDELADRGKNDYFILLIFDKLRQEHINYEILFSNHGREFVSVYEQGLANHTSYMEEDWANCASSLTNLRKLIIKKMVSIEEIDRLVKEAYQPALKILSYTINTLKEDLQVGNSEPKRSLTIYSHAPIGINTMKGLGKELNVPFIDETPEKLGQTIDHYNRIFSKTVCQNKVGETFGAQLKKQENDKIPIEKSMRRCIWARGIQDYDVPVSAHKGYGLFFLHGHDGGGKVHQEYKENVTNLDNSFGKGDKGNEKPYSIACNFVKD